MALDAVDNVEPLRPRHVCPTHDEEVACPTNSHGAAHQTTPNNKGKKVLAAPGVELTAVPLEGIPGTHWDGPRHRGPERKDRRQQRMLRKAGVVFEMLPSLSSCCGICAPYTTPANAHGPRTMQTQSPTPAPPSIREDGGARLPDDRLGGTPPSLSLGHWTLGLQREKTAGLEPMTALHPSEGAPRQRHWRWAVGTATACERLSAELALDPWTLRVVRVPKLVVGKIITAPNGCRPRPHRRFHSSGAEGWKTRADVKLQGDVGGLDWDGGRKVSTSEMNL
ncbi:hypothetical protein NLJ89_g11409 [Agrocybe chaxingu]|uniref:Uncharacterized protein n=1 Tax=Agrocybe chaxingu TaxID=84603 RepID=A0A9W8MRN3_9AGAR|nr:hypothetical protein NLJ89_g11409 [Agrocybe chaxingu]